MLARSAAMINMYWPHFTPSINPVLPFSLFPFFSHFLSTFWAWFASATIVAFYKKKISWQRPCNSILEAVPSASWDKEAVVRWGEGGRGKGRGLGEKGVERGRGGGWLCAVIIISQTDNLGSRGKHHQGQRQQHKERPRKGHLKYPSNTEVTDTSFWCLNVSKRIQKRQKGRFQVIYIFFA